MAQNRDANFQVTPTRKGDPPGGIIDLPIADLTANQWDRLCPSGDSATIVTGNARQLTLGELRDDVKNTDFYDWKLKILNPEVDISPIDVSHIDDSTGLCTLREDIPYHSSLPAAIEWVLYPVLYFPLLVVLEDNSPDDIEVGIIKIDKYTPLATEVRRIYRMNQENSNNSVAVRTDRVDKVFYRFPSLSASGTETIIWSEGIISRG